MTQSTSGSFWGRVTEKTEYFWNTNLYFALMLAAAGIDSNKVKVQVVDGKVIITKE